MILDIHSHIIPDVDDGAKTVQDAVKILKSMKDQGTDLVIATPHFDLLSPQKAEKRAKIEQNYKQLLAATEGMDLPEIHLGFEVVFNYELSSMEDLEDYTLAGTNKILIELPFGRITDRIITELEEVAFKKNLVPILAHLERYVCYEGIEKIYEAIWNGTMRAQVTADTVETFMGRRSISKLIKKEIFSYIGSDAHSVLERPSKIKKFLSFIKSKHKEFYRVYNESSDRLYNDIKNK